MAKDRSLRLRLRAIDKMSSVIDRVQKKFPKLTRGIQRASRVSKIFNAQTKQMRASLLKIGGGLKSFGRSMTIGVTLPLLAAGAAGVKFFGDFEQGLAGIEKTTGITGPALEKLGKTFDQLSTEIPVSTAEMLELAKAGGQLGIKGAKNIEKFTITMAKLSRASDVAGEAGAKSIARILKVTGTGIDKVDRFSAALVDLGNNAAAGEQEILEVANRVAGQIGRFDVASDKVLGIATALKSLGKNAESAGSVIGRSFDAIDQSIKKGGIQIQVLSKLTGIATKDLKQQFSVDATKVFEKFVGGLSKVGKGGGNMIKIMGALGLSGVRVNDILGTLAKRPEVLTENLKRASKAFSENTALQKEFEIQTRTLNSSFIKISNTFKSLLTLIGAELAPVVEFFGKIITKILNILRENPALRTFVIILGTIAAVMGPVLIAVGTFLVLLPLLTAGVIALDTALLPLIAPFLLIGLAIGAVIAISVLLFKKWGTITKFFNKNPFGKFIKFLFLVLTPLGQIITVVKLVSAAFKGLDAFKTAARDILPTGIGNLILGEKKEKQKEKKDLLAPGAGVLRLNKNLDSLKNIFPSGINKINERADSLKNVFPIRRQDNLLGKEKGDLPADLFGPEKGVLKAVNKIGEAKAREREKAEAFSGVLDVNFRGAPEGTNVKAKTQGPLDFNLGFAGGLQ